LDFEAEHLLIFIRQTDFPILVINIRERETEKLLARYYLIQQLGASLEIGILGIAYPDTPFTTISERDHDEQI
jgi:2',3'-cyclic-nucleotide 2'-phosphodiesterase (5'-nucleotidase family)